MDVRISAAIILGVCCTLCSSASPLLMKELEEQLNFSPSIWYFDSTGVDDTCSSIPPEGPKPRDQGYFNCTGKPLGTILCHCVDETIDNLPETNPKRYDNMCATCRVGLEPVREHLGEFQDMMAWKHVMGMLLALTPAEYTRMFGDSNLMMVPCDTLKGIKVAKRLSWGLKSLARKSKDPKAAKVLLNRLALSGVRKLPVPGLDIVIEEDGRLNPGIKEVIDSGTKLLSALMRSLPTVVDNLGRRT